MGISKDDWLHKLFINEAKAALEGAGCFTEADKAEMLNEIVACLDGTVRTEVSNRLEGVKSDFVAELIAQIGGMPVFGTVDDNNTITVTSTLADGDYILVYENENGTIEEIGAITVDSGAGGSAPAPTYTNQIPLSVNADGSEYVGANGEDGYNTGHRVNSSGAEVAQTGMCCTGYIQYNSQTMRLDNVEPSGAATSYVAFYNQDKTFHQVRAFADILQDDGMGVYTGSVDHAGWIRITCGVIDATSILTLDEEIT